MQRNTHWRWRRRGITALGAAVAISALAAATATSGSAALPPPPTPPPPPCDLTTGVCTFPSAGPVDVYAPLGSFSVTTPGPLCVTVGGAPSCVPVPPQSLSEGGTLAAHALLGGGSTNPPLITDCGYIGFPQDQGVVIVLSGVTGDSDVRATVTATGTQNVAATLFFHNPAGNHNVVESLCAG